MGRIKNDNVQEELKNYLVNKKIKIKFIPKEGIITDKKHVLYGGMAETSTIKIVTPVQGNFYKKVLTDDEQLFCEKELGLEEGALNPSKSQDNFWDDSNNKYSEINSLYLKKQGNYLDLSTIEGFIKYKILLANNTLICKSNTEFKNHPKASYRFVLEDNEESENSILSKIDNKKLAFKLLDQYQDNIDALRTILFLIEKHDVPKTSKLINLQNKVYYYVDNEFEKFNKIVNDKFFTDKILLYKCIDKGIVYRNKNYFYDKETNEPLSEYGLEPTFANAILYLNKEKNMKLKSDYELKVN